MPGKNWTRHNFETRAALAQALAGTVAGQLREAITLKGEALLAVSGGSTPALFLEALSNADLEWERVVVTLIDERFVGADSPRSNERLVKANLFNGPAAKAAFVPLFRPANDVVSAAADAAVAIGKLALPLDVAVLGMGNDGHTASFFPDADELELLLDTAAKPLVSAVHANSAGEDRLTLTLPPIAAARFVALHVEGDEKEATLEKALAAGSTLPIRRVIDAAQTSVEIFWAP